MDEMYKQYGISDKVLEYSKQTMKDTKDIFEKIDEISEYNSLKVLRAFQDNGISEMHFGMTTGYGYSDIGRDTIEKVFAEVLGAEDSLVRNQIVSGTHALTVTLFAMLRPGDTMISISSKPYDTLDSVIGITENKSSLMSYGVKYEQIDLINDNCFDIPKIKERIAKGGVKLVEIQRSRGYAIRESIEIEKVAEITKIIKDIDPNVIVMVDNCYCEFVGEHEPTEYGVDIMVGSLIKNLGGGIAPNGAYIAGRKDLVELAGERLTVPGQGKEIGPSLGINKSLLQGLFFAPSVVASSLKTAVFASRMLELAGYEVAPKYNDVRPDITQMIIFHDPKLLIKYCQGIQMGSPVDSESIPEPWDMPGYGDQVIMAAGTFTQGSSIELSCDGPVRPPYVAYMQGGLTFEYGKIGVLKAVQNLYNN